MDDKIRKILEQPFPPEAIKQRQGPGGKVLHFVEVQSYIDKLNVAFAGDWSLETIRREQVDDQLIVEVRLTAGNIIKTGLGGATITRRRDDGRMMALADDYKKAEADAIKRACRLLGVGATLYGSEVGTAENDSADERRFSRPVVAMAAPPYHFSSRAEAPAEPGRISQKQIGYIVSLASKAGIERGDLEARVLEEYGKRLAFLSSREASALIGDLGGGNGHAHRGERVVGQEG